MSFLDIKGMYKNRFYVHFYQKNEIIFWKKKKYNKIFVQQNGKISPNPG
jgi:hypothetical protein